MCKRFLEKDGSFSVDILTSTRIAREQLNRERYDAIIFDYQMPKMIGIEFLRELKSSGSTTLLSTSRKKDVKKWLLKH